MDWFRYYTEALHDPKVQRLPDRLFKAWVNLLCLARLNDGVIPGIEDVSYHLRIAPDKAAQILSDLGPTPGRGLLDRTEHGLMPHNWDERQPSSDSSAERMRRYRANKKRNGDGQGDVTVTVQSRTDKNRAEREKSVTVTPPSNILAAEDGFSEFREAFSEYGAKASDVDWQEAHAFEWRKLDFHQRLAAVKGIRDRIDAGAVNDPAASSLPKNYLAKRMWERAIRTDRPKGRDLVGEILGTSN